jgi:hypothetical protein
MRLVIVFSRELALSCSLIAGKMDTQFVMNAARDMTTGETAQTVGVDLEKLTVVMLKDRCAAAGLAKSGV